jgi:hypothetical protein
LTPLKPSVVRSQQQDRCRCKKCDEKRKRQLSDKVAKVKPYDRRMSVYSLKNLNRGSKAAKVAGKLRKFVK